MGKTINLYLDDLRDCPKGFIVARTFDQAVDLIERHTIDVLSLDHDLGSDEDGNLLPTGYDFVKKFCEEGHFANKIYIHTDNVIGRENMYETLLAAQRRGFISKEIEIYRHPHYWRKN